MPSSIDLVRQRKLLEASCQLETDFNKIAASREQSRWDKHLAYRDLYEKLKEGYQGRFPFVELDNKGGAKVKGNDSRPLSSFFNTDDFNEHENFWRALSNTSAVADTHFGSPFPSIVMTGIIGLVVGAIFLSIPFMLLFPRWSDTASRWGGALLGLAIGVAGRILYLKNKKEYYPPVMISAYVVEDATYKTRVDKSCSEIFPPPAAEEKQSEVVRPH
ncbi:MAG: DUF3995 domain-containing protein [Deltaproteobacteria bacterium]|nr:DUF3995 domain-containing protein [Deltaproteobacteria bacterium]